MKDQQAELRAEVADLLPLRAAALRVVGLWRRGLDLAVALEHLSQVLGVAVPLVAEEAPSAPHCLGGGIV